MISARAGLCALLAIGVVSLSATSALAYPQWQFSSGTSRCSQCHYSPVGGGLINGYGRDAAGEDLSTWDGDGSFLHGAIELPKSLALGFDGRYSVLVQNVGEARGATVAYFPMQADGYVRLALGEALSVYGVLGYRGQARSVNEQLGAGASTPIGGRFISREHYVMYRPETMGVYARAGRFFAPFGLRLAEHYAYVRRDLGYNLLQENYGLSIGYLKAQWELHVTGFIPDVVRDLGSNETGGAALFERRVGDASAIGLSGRYGKSDDMARYVGGVFIKSYLESTRALFQTELNVVHSEAGSGATAASTDGFVGYVGITFIPTTGLWVTPFGERKQTSIAVRKSATDAAGIQINWFPMPHFELTWMGRAQIPEGDATGLTSMFFLHYYL
jgi:hypothetical protein